MQSWSIWSAYYPRRSWERKENSYFGYSTPCKVRRYHHRCRRCFILRLLPSLSLSSTSSTHSFFASTSSMRSNFLIKKKIDVIVLFELGWIDPQRTEVDSFVLLFLYRQETQTSKVKRLLSNLVNLACNSLKWFAFQFQNQLCRNV